MKNKELLSLLLTNLSSVVALIGKVGAAVSAGKANDFVTEEDHTELNRLSNLTAEDIYERAGVTPPPKPTPPATPSEV